MDVSMNNGMQGMQSPQALPSVPQQGFTGAPNEKALLDLMERTGYPMIQENGQRKYGGPPPGWGDKPMPKGSEIFVGKIPRDCFEDELVPIFEQLGPIYELRLMMDFSGSNRGYCFVMYTKRSDAKRAVQELNNFELPNRRGRFIGVCLSVDNCRLFVGGIPKNKTKEEIYAEMCKVVEEVKDIIVYPSVTDKSKNRGFAFVEFESHRAAAMARRKLIPGRIQLWGHQIAVDWAEPEQDVDEDIMSKVKILYVRNLMLSTTEESLESVFTQACGVDNSVERVKKIRDYAFVHFRERECAAKALKLLNGKSLEGSTIEVVWAKPVDKQEYQRQTRNDAALVGLKGVPMAAMQSIPTAYALAVASADPLQYAYLQSQLAAAAAAASRPGGLQAKLVAGASRGPIRGRGRGAAGSRAAGTTGRGVPGYLKHFKKPAVEVTLPALAGQYPSPTFQPNKLTRSVDDAKTYAAEYVLMQLGYPMDNTAVASYAGAGDASSQFAAAYGASSAAGMSGLLQQPGAGPDAATAAALYHGRPLAPPGYPLTSPSPNMVASASDLGVATSAAYLSMTAGMPYMSAASRAPQPQLAAHQNAMLAAAGLGYQPAGTWYMG